ncbi:MAG: HEAT repeat domain-containing protein [Kofleriaceae bacterium]
MKLATIGCLLGAAGVAEAGPLAQVRDDLDGNGTQDTVELTADGVMHIDDASHAQIKIASAVTKGKITVARLPGSTQLVIDLTSGAAREAVVLDRAKAWNVVARFPLGGVGLDREFGIDVDVTATGIYRYQSRWDVRRCDDKPAYLFGEKLENGQFKKLDKLPTYVPDSAPVLPAKLDAGAATAPLIYQARAASHQAGASDAGALAIPRELDDGRLETGWREDLASAGEGQFFTFKPRVESARAQQLRIVPGNPASAGAMKASGRVHKLAIVTKQNAWRVELPDAANDPLGSAYVVELPALAECVTVVIESVHGRGPTAIAELAIFADGERTGGGAALLAKVIAEGKSDVTNVTATLAKQGAAGAKAIDGELAKTTDAAARRRLIIALAKIRDPAAAATLVRAATEGWVRDKDLLDVIAALASNSQWIALRDLAARSGVAVELRVAAAHRLAPATAFDALVSLAGSGPRELRHEVIERMSPSPLDPLVAAATAATTAATAGDLWRAATRGARVNQAARPAVVAAMLAALPSAADYERRYRLIDGIANHGDAAALASLAAFLRGLPVDGPSSALRQVAIRGIASSPRPEASPLVIAYARDADPGVRLAALSAIANAESDAAGVWHAADGPAAIDRVLVNAMADNWPEIRRRAATALGARCQRLGPARALFEAVGVDRDLAVRSDSLTALVQCQAAGIRELLAQTWDNAKQPLELRRHAVGLVVALGDKQLAGTLVRKFTRWRGEAIESKDALMLAQSAAATIGQMRVAGAAEALTSALEDSAFPEIVSAAALALGALGPACPAVAKAKLTALARSDDQSALAARRAAAQCGR